MKNIIYNELRQHLISLRSLSLLFILLLICFSNIISSLNNKKDEALLLETFEIKNQETIERYKNSVRSAALGNHKILRKNNNLSFVSSDGINLPNLIEFSIFRFKNIESLRTKRIIEQNI